MVPDPASLLLLLLNLNKDSLLLINDFPLLSLIIQHNLLGLDLHLLLLLSPVRGRTSELLNSKHLGLLLLSLDSLLLGLLGHLELLLSVSSFSLLLRIGRSLLEQGRGRGCHLGGGEVHHLDEAFTVCLGGRVDDLVIFVESDHSGAAFAGSGCLVDAFFSVIIHRFILLLLFSDLVILFFLRLML